MATTNTNSWVAYLRSNPEACVRLFCFPYAGGGASIFRTWQDDLPPSIEVYPVQLPGRENRLREPPFTRLAPLVQALAQGLGPYLNMPFAFFGHSMGALIGFELARHLEQNGLEPVHLFVSGHQAPPIPSMHSLIHQLPEAQFIEELGHFNGTPEGVLQHAELMQLLLPVLRADFAINETYTCAAGAVLNCPVSAFGGLQDDQVSRDGLMAWRDQTDGAFALHMFPGDHFFLRSAQTLLLRTLAQELTQSLNRITGG